MNSDDHYRLRIRCYNRFTEWKLKSDIDFANSGPQLLAQLCGRDAVFQPHVKMTDQELEVCERLLGPHGYTYYKMLEARND